MKVAIIGSRTVNNIDIKLHLPHNCTEIVSGGAKGVDRKVAEYAITHNFKLTEFLPDYRRYNKGAPLIRNKQIVNYADEVIAFWNGKSKGTFAVINYCKKNR
ncbi:MAG: DUF2493 domain-containing protein [Clostridiales bacterium]|nr:DUF2493 domain-containing protein [Clostridiales bacterium]